MFICNNIRTFHSKCTEISYYNEEEKELYLQHAEHFEVPHSYTVR